MLKLFNYYSIFLINFCPSLLKLFSWHQPAVRHAGNCVTAGVSCDRLIASETHLYTSTNLCPLTDNDHDSSATVSCDARAAAAAADDDDDDAWCCWFSCSLSSSSSVRLQNYSI